MVIIYGKLQSSNRLEVHAIHNHPEQLTEEEKTGGYLVESVPDPELIDGKIHLIIFNPEDGAFAVEYYDDTAVDPIKRIKDLEAQNAQMLLALVMGGLM